MKKLFFFAGFLFFVFPATAQITDTGNNVGIGTANPLEKLQVNGTLYLNSGTDVDNIFWARHYLNMGTRPGSYNHNILNLRPGGATQGLLHSQLNMFVTASQGNYENKVRIHSYGDSFFNGGNVGIGTSTPKTKLHIFNGGSNGNPHGFSDLTVEDDDHVMLALLTQNNKNAYYGFADQDDDYVGGIQYEHSTDRMVFRVNDHTSDMVIINNGNVGIGTTNPDAKLTVTGNINSREVKVTVNAGADFVFEDNYNLPSLEEVQQFINEYGHLPEIASAKDMEANGIHLAEMSIKLLQKIEELTLYAVEQEEKIKKQEVVIQNFEIRDEKQESKNKELEERLSKLEQIINE